MSVLELDQLEDEVVTLESSDFLFISLPKENQSQRRTHIKEVIAHECRDPKERLSVKGQYACPSHTFSIMWLQNFCHIFCLEPFHHSFICFRGHIDSGTRDHEFVNGVWIHVSNSVCHKTSIASSNDTELGDIELLQELHYTLCLSSPAPTEARGSVIQQG